MKSDARYCDPASLRLVSPRAARGRPTPSRPLSAGRAALASALWPYLQPGRRHLDLRRRRAAAPPAGSAGQLASRRPGPAAPPGRPRRHNGGGRPAGTAQRKGAVPKGSAPSHSLDLSALADERLPGEAACGGLLTIETLTLHCSSLPSERRTCSCVFTCRPSERSSRCKGVP